MSDLNLDEIRRRQTRALVFVSHERTNEYDPDHTARAAYILTVGDVPKLLAEVDRLRAKLEGPCGSCHPCTEYSDETWRAAGRKPPHVSEWDELRAELDRLRAKLAGDDDSRLATAERRVSLAQGMAEDWAGSKDVVLASAGRALLNVTGGAR